MTLALTRQGNAWYLIGNEDKAIEDHERALQIIPSSSDNLFFLGAILFEGGDGDLPRLRRAKQYWQQFSSPTRTRPRKARLEGHPPAANGHRQPRTRACRAAAPDADHGRGTDSAAPSGSAPQ